MMMMMMMMMMCRLFWCEISLVSSCGHQTHTGHLKVHVLCHEGVKPHACSEYPKRFCTTFEFNSRQQVKSDIKQFCILCTIGTQTSLILDVRHC